MSGTLDSLIRMAEQIARNFAHAPDPAVATADHIAHFWDPRMKRLIREHVASGGALSPVALAAVRGLATEGAPPPQTPATHYAPAGAPGGSDAG